MMRVRPPAVAVVAAATLRATTRSTVARVVADGRRIAYFGDHGAIFELYVTGRPRQRRIWACGGADVIRALAGADVVARGAGDDVVRGDGADRLDCGTGARDHAVRSGVYVVLRSCERVTGMRRRGGR